MRLGMDGLLALHVLGAVVWVGGMAFALLVLRPSLAVLPGETRLALHAEVFRRFFRIVAHVVPTMIVTGYAMLFLGYGGFSRAAWPVHAMNGLGLVMSVVFVAILAGPWRAMRQATAGRDSVLAMAAVARIRRLIWLNLALGVLTVMLGTLS